MAEQLASTKLDHDAHLLLDQPLLRLPHELLRKNLKTAQRQIEIANKAITSSISAAITASPTDVLANLDATIQKAQTLKRKLEALHEEEKTLHRQQKARIRHLQALHEIPGLADVKYDAWAHVRLDRLLVDYLLRRGYAESAVALAREKGIEELVDIGVFAECGRIERSLQRGEVKEALAWCLENKQALRKINSTLEPELRLQQFIELARTGDMPKLMEAIMHARKHLSTPPDAPSSAQDSFDPLDPDSETSDFGLRAAGLLAHTPDTLVEPYRTLYSPARYASLAARFLRTHHALFALPAAPLLHIALSAGLSALKTPACHSVHAVSTGSGPTTSAAMCPICAPELNELARNVPYAHHTKSFVDEDAVVLPNGRVFGREKLRALNEKLGVPPGRVRDPTMVGSTEAVEWDEGVLKKVYIS